MQFVIKTKQERTNGTYDSFATIAVDHKIKELNHHKLGLSYTASGYGMRIPTKYMVRFNDRWRRVYCCSYSNSGTLFIGSPQDSLIVDTYGN